MLKRPPRGDDQKEERIYGTHPGDVGVVLIAALLTFAWIALLLMPSPFARLQKAQEQAAKAEQQAAKAKRQKEIDQAVASGEVGVSIMPGKNR